LEPPLPHPVEIDHRPARQRVGRGMEFAGMAGDVGNEPVGSGRGRRGHGGNGEGEPERTLFYGFASTGYPVPH
jgi:hypothetical protein